MKRQAHERWASLFDSTRFVAGAVRTQIADLLPRAKTVLFLGLCVICVTSAFVTLLVLSRLLEGPFPVGGQLYVEYFTYAVAVVVAVHSAFFVATILIRQRGGKPPKSLPKYLEYAYAALLAVGLFQVFTSQPRFADYIGYVSGSEESLLQEIRVAAIRHLKHDCWTPPDVVFTNEFCEQMGDIVSSADLETLIDTIAADPRYHLGQDATVGNKLPIPPTPLAVSPVADLIQTLIARRKLKAIPLDPERQNAFTWIALLLLPPGIALRLTKTSLELFGRLE